MSMEARTAFDRLLIEGEQVEPAAVAVPTAVIESDEAAVMRQNREAAKAWGGMGA